MQTFASIRFKQLIACSAMLCLFCASKAPAQIVLDGSMGQSGELRGPDYVITAGMGSQYGSNIFHSFDVFNVNTDESATFTGPALVDNVIGRVTGGLASDIDGRLSCSIDGANLYLINPSGIIFGPHASLDVTGSFVATTADYVKLSDGGRFDVANPSASVLSSAPVSAFGFLDGNIGAITVDRAYLQVDDGKSISMVGGDIEIWNGYLVAPGGRIDLVSAASKGEVLPSANAAPDVSSFDRLGNINIKHDDPNRLADNANNSLGNIDTSGEGGGAIYIRGGQLVMDGGRLYARTYGGNNGVGIDIDVTGKADTGAFTMTNGALISSSTYGSGKGGNTTVKANSISMDGVTPDGNYPTGIFADSSTVNATGDSGSVTIDTVTLTMTGGAWISAHSSGSGKGGNTTVKANSISLDNSVISAGSGATDAGAGGTITVDTGTLTMSGGAWISSSTWGLNSGKGGDVTIKANAISLDGVTQDGQFATGIYVVTSGLATGGSLTIDTVTLTMTGGARISVNTSGPGKGGDVTVKANAISLDGVTQDGQFATGISANSQPTVFAGGGAGGSVTIDTGTLAMTGGSQIGATSWSIGKAGDIRLNTSILLSISGSSVTTASDHSSGGSITINGGSVILTNGGDISSSVAYGEGGGGNVTINSMNLLALYSSNITANATDGRGGKVFLNTDAYIHSTDSIITANSNKLELQGTVSIQSPALDIGGSLGTLSTNYTTGAVMASDRCAARSFEDASSFTLGGRDGIPLDPESAIQWRVGNKDGCGVI